MIVRIGIAQLKVHLDKQENVGKAVEQIGFLASEGADMIVLPEMFNCPYSTKNFANYAEPEGGETWHRLSDAAKDNNVYLVGGSIPEADANRRIYNTCYIFDRFGKQIGKHRKMHLFDIKIESGQSFKESETLSSGDAVTVYDTEFGKIGTAICYDFRFPELARKMVLEGAKIIIVPAAFNMTTGPAHWEIMFRQRAIDNQAYTVGVAPARDLEAEYTSYANSIVVSPWGEVIFRMGEAVESKVVELDMQVVEKVRNELPLLKHRRTDIYELNWK